MTPSSLRNASSTCQKQPAPNVAYSVWVVVPFSVLMGLLPIVSPFNDGIRLLVTRVGAALRGDQTVNVRFAGV